MILIEAIQLFSNQGYFATTMSKIAEVAKARFGSIAYYYESKGKQLLLVRELGGSPLGRITKMINGQMKFFIQQSSSLRLVQYVIAQRDQFLQIMSKILILWEDSKEIVFL
ncbi:TetR/AcrR family transcriptional regulator [Bacillus luti]|uniref:TetR/AcrR family transcriptional regulator n=1 Tax=Bacillus luti TaxID=2026191 RepID=UPI0012E98D2C|nr:TetR family transcriptional regulator [Bacillus luti]